MSIICGQRVATWRNPETSTGLLEMGSHTYKWLIYGDYKDLDPVSPNIFCYTRTLGSEKYLVVLNFSAAPTTYTIPGGLKAGTLAASNLGSTEQHTSTLNLKPW